MSLYHLVEVNASYMSNIPSKTDTNTPEVLNIPVVKLCLDIIFGFKPLNTPCDAKAYQLLVWFRHGAQLKRTLPLEVWVVNGR
jgi:hypothetical protein